MASTQQDRLNAVTTEARIHPNKTLVHPRNRSGTMLDVSAVSEQAADISDVSFSWHEVQQACAVRMPPYGSPARLTIELKNEELVAASMGQLAPVIRDDATVAVTGCNHNTAGLKAMNAKANCSIPRLSEHGKYT